MNSIKNTKQQTMMALLFSVGLLMSLNVFAAPNKPPPVDMATQAELDAAIASEASARQTADTTLQTNIGAEAAAREKAIADLQAQIDHLTNIIAGPPYAIGDVGPAGGIVFYITEGGAHGLEAAPVDQGVVPWGCYLETISGADGTAVGTGQQNTADILAGCSQDGIAAKIAADYRLNRIDDWYLPSKDELNLMWNNLADSDGNGQNIGLQDPNFGISYYWSSTEFDSGVAWGQDFVSGDQYGTNKGSPVGVRAVRAF